MALKHSLLDVAEAMAEVDGKAYDKLLSVYTDGRETMEKVGQRSGWFGTTKRGSGQQDEERRLLGLVKEESMLDLSPTHAEHMLTTESSTQRTTNITGTKRRSVSFYGLCFACARLMLNVCSDGDSRVRRPGAKSKSW